MRRGIDGSGFFIFVKGMEWAIGIGAAWPIGNSKGCRIGFRVVKEIDRKILSKSTRFWTDTVWIACGTGPILIGWHDVGWHVVIDSGNETIDEGSDNQIIGKADAVFWR
jgi:hypothetical protein